jgi:hypothetical protein
MNRLRTGVDELDEIFMGGGKSETNLNKIIFRATKRDFLDYMVENHGGK